MNTKPILARPGNLSVGVTAFLSAVIGIGLLGAVTGMFQSRGLPLAEFAAAERACAAHAYVSEREVCVREWVVAARGNRVARR